VARFTAFFALVLISMLSGQPTAVAAADPSQAASTAGTKPAIAKTKKAKSAKNKVPTVKAPAAKPAQPVPAVQPTPPKPPETKPVDDKAKQADTKAGPRFASLRAEKVFLRAGPGPDFPIQWVFVRRGLPVEILATFDIFRKIRDSDGTVGWVNQQMLTGRRSILVSGAIRDLHHDANPGSEVVAQLEPGVVAAVSKCDPAWCEVKAGGYKGWLKRDEVWGLEPDEVIQ
jgi:SH3-like domain-containing protein